MKYRAIITLAALTAAGVLTGCDGDDASETVEEATPAEAAAAERARQADERGERTEEKLRHGLGNPFEPKPATRPG